MSIANESEGRSSPYGIERAFGIENDSFHKYMGFDHSGGNRHIHTRQITLMDLSERMESHDNPIVRYAAGWAAAEAVLSRPELRQDREVFPRNQERAELWPKALHKARSIWLSLDTAFEHAVDNSQDPRVAADYTGIDLRRKQALAYLPAMRLVARWFSGSQPPLEKVEQTLRQTKEEVVQFGRDTLDSPWGGKYLTWVKGGVCSEIITGLLLQSSDSTSHVIVPASFRQDNNINRTLRADLMAVKTEPRHPKTLIQVTSDVKISNRRLVVSRGEIVWPGGYPAETLTAFIDRENTSRPITRKNFAEERCLDDLAAALNARLDEFVPTGRGSQSNRKANITPSQDPHPDDAL